MVRKPPLYCRQIRFPLLPQETHDHVVQRRQHLRRVAPPHLAGILRQRHVPSVVQPVLVLLRLCGQMEGRAPRLEICI